MEREAQVPDVAFFALGHEVTPQVKVLEEVSPGVAEIVEKVEVEVSCPGTLKRCRVLTECVLAGLAVNPRGIFGCELEFLSGITFNECLTDCVLTACISPRRVEVREARRKKLIDHLLDLLNVDNVLFT